MLTGEEIISKVESGDITIEPFDKSNVNPNSYNITLGNELFVYLDDVLDSNKENKKRKIIIPDDGYILAPNRLYLVKTNEVTGSKKFVPQLSGRSSVGRIGLTVHVSAGCGVVGSNEAWILGLTCVVPTKIVPGMEIGQVYFFPLVGENNKNYKNPSIKLECED